VFAATDVPTLFVATASLVVAAVAVFVSLWVYRKDHDWKKGEERRQYQAAQRDYAAERGRLEVDTIRLRLLVPEHKSAVARLEQECTRLKEHVLALHAQDDEPGKTAVALADQVILEANSQNAASAETLKRCEEIVEQLSEFDETTPELSLTLVKLAPRARIAVLTTRASLRSVNDRLKEPLAP